MRSLHARSSTVVAALAAAAFAVGSADAQPGPRGGPDNGRGWGPSMMMGPGMMGGRGFGAMCNPRAAGMAEWRIERIEAAVKPTDAQREALDTLRAASTKAAETISAACTREAPAKAPERLALMEQRLDAMHLAIKTVRPAFDAFYASLGEEQKVKLDAAGPRRWGWANWHWRWSN